MCTGLEVAAIVGATAAATSAGVGVAGAVSAEKRAGRQEALERERKAQLLKEQKARDEARRRAATQGTRAGRGGAGGRGAVTTGLGLGTGDTAGFSGGTLFGN